MRVNIFLKADGVALTNVCRGLSVKTAHAAEVPTRGVDPPLLCDEGTVDYVFGMGVGVEVPWGEECCVVSCGDVRPLMLLRKPICFRQASSAEGSLRFGALKSCVRWRTVSWSSGICGSPVSSTCLGAGIVRRLCLCSLCPTSRGGSRCRSRCPRRGLNIDRLEQFRLTRLARRSIFGLW
jgi:hypothetical protein